MSATGADQQQEELVEIGSFRLIDPGGDPAVLRAAAEQWQARAADLRATGDELSGAVAGLSRAEWDGDARDAFAAWWGQRRGEVDRLAEGFDEMAAQLRTVADAIEETNSVVHSIYLEIGATVAIGVAASLVTFGLGTAAAAARTAALVQRALSWVQRLTALMRAVRASSRALVAFRTTFLTGKLGRFAGLYGRSLAINATAGTVQRMVFERTLNPFAHWTAGDLRNLVVGSAAGVGVNRVAGVGRLGVWTRRDPMRSAAAQGFVATAGNTVLFDALDGQLRRGTAAEALVAGVAGAGSAGLLHRLTAGRPGTHDPYRPGAPNGWTQRPSGLATPPSGLAPPAGGGGLAVGGGRAVRPRPSGLLVPRWQVTLPPAPAGLPAHSRQPSGLYVVDPPPGFVGGGTPPQPAPGAQRVAANLGVKPSVNQFRSEVSGALERDVSRPVWDLPRLSLVAPPPPPAAVPASSP